MTSADDGPNNDYTRMLLSGLKERGVKATFFLLGKEVDKYPEIVAEIHADGHLIGTHSYEHVNLKNLCDEAAIEQVDKTNEAIHAITGEYPEYIRPDGHLIGTHSYEHVNLKNLCDEAAIEQVDKTNEAIHAITGEYPEYIRPPFGSWKCNLDYETKMIEVLWDIDPLDWKTNNSDVIAKRVTDKVTENDIILLHDASESSVLAAFKIIDQLEREGYTFVTVDEILFD